MKVWLTSVFLGPVIYYIWRYPPGQDIWDVGQYMLLAAVGALVVTSPCWLLLWAGARFIMKKATKKSSKTKRFLLAAWAVFLTSTPFLILFSNDDPNTGSDTLSMWISYLVPILAGVSFYRLPEATHEPAGAPTT